MLYRMDVKISYTRYTLTIADTLVNPLNVLAEYFLTINSNTIYVKSIHIRETGKGNVP